MRAATTRFRRACAIVVLGSQLLTGCTTIPPFVLFGDQHSDAPVGPKLAALVANLKCELWDATHSNNVLPYYTDIPSLTQKNHVASGDRAFTLNNIFQEIEYVAEASYTLDVYATSSLTPTEIYSNPIQAAKGLLPATSFALAVSGTLSDMPHRQLNFDLSADFSRLVGIETNPQAKNLSTPTPVVKDQPAPGTCDGGSELAGDLGLKEALAGGMIAMATNDIAVFPEGTAVSGVNANNFQLPSTFAFGQIATTVDFTINEGISGGPTWTLRHFKGPGGGMGPITLSREVVDKVVITFVPVCIRQKYATTSKAPPYKYEPEPVDGTPGWANYLPQCGAATHVQDQTDALAKAKSNNTQILLQNSVAAPSL